MDPKKQIGDHRRIHQRADDRLGQRPDLGLCLIVERLGQRRVKGPGVQKCRLRCRQLGLDPVVLGYSSSKTSKREPKRRRKESEYGMQLREKQKVKFIYGVLEKQFHGYFEKAKAMPGITGENLMRILESRLDSVIFRLGFARTRKEARQIVTHGHIMVNGRRVDVPSYRVKAGDVVSVAPKSKELLVIKSALVSNARFEVPAWLEVDIEKLQGNVLALPQRDQIDLDINEQLIVELYSK